MRAAPALLCLLCILAPLPGAAAEDAPSGDGLTADAIYERVLENRFASFRQHATLVSGDRADNAQESRMTVLWKSFRDGDDEPVDGVLSKTVVRYTHPFDLRFSAYLVINNRDRANDQFVYLPSRRRVRRVNLRGEPVLGSDFSFEDVVPREFEEARYTRLPDEQLDGRDCFVIELEPAADANSEYSRLRSWIDRETYVVVRTRYWNQDGVEVKHLRAPFSEVQKFDHVYVPMDAEMRNLLTGSWSHIRVDRFEPNPELDPGAFTPRRLETH